MPNNIVIDDTPVDVSTEVNFIWSIANKLRGTYQSDKYKDVIIPMTIIRRFECALEDTKDAVIVQVEKDEKSGEETPDLVYQQIAGYQFYNKSRYTLKELCNDSPKIKTNFESYLEGFSPNAQDIINNLEFKKQIDKMDANNRLFSVVQAFSEIDLSPKTIDNIKMGYIFEELIRKFSENAEAGDHYTGRDIIKCMVSILLSEGCEDLKEPQKEITILDQDEKDLAEIEKEKTKKPAYDAILKSLNEAQAKYKEKKWLSPEDFEPILTEILEIPKQVRNDANCHAELVSASTGIMVEKKIFEKIKDGLSVMDKEAVFQKDKKGEIIYDTETKDTEIVAYKESIDDYMAREVLPHIPDAKAFFEENLGAKKPVIKTGAEIPFTKHFYKYIKPRASSDLAKEFTELEKSVSSAIKELFEE